MNVPTRFDGLFRQLTPLFLLGVIAAVVCEPWVPGAAWLTAKFGDGAVLRACVAALALYVLLLWGESLRLHTILTGVLQAFREFDGGSGQSGGKSVGTRNAKARFEAAKLLIAALGSADPDIRASSHHNLRRLTGVDQGTTPGAWQQWLAEQEPPGS